MVKNREINMLHDIESCNNFFGVATHHPLVNVIDFSEVKSVGKIPDGVGIYSIMLYWDNTTEEDSNTSASLTFNTPSPNHRYRGDIFIPNNGWLLIFDPKLTKSTLLANRLHEYPFFSNPQNNSIQLTNKERIIVQNCMRSIFEELSNNNDRFSSRILTAGIAVILNISMRYYERQYYHTNNSSAHNILLRLNQLLEKVLRQPSHIKRCIPTVAWCAGELNLSPNYLGEAIRKSSNQSAQEYIRNFIISEAKYRLQYSHDTISEIAYNLGFKYPHHLTRVFKKVMGETPIEFKRRLSAIKE